jgi:methyl-accepting chemotaxis protein
VHQASKQVDAASEQLAGSSSSLAEVSEQQSNAVASSAAAVEQLTVAISSVSDTAQDVQRQASESVERTTEGSQKVSQLVGEVARIQQNMGEIARTVDEFVRSTQAITGMTKEVRDIADQTNLLALNAAIEAGAPARPGAVLPWSPTRCANWPRNPASRPTRSMPSPIRSWRNPMPCRRPSKRGESIDASTQLAGEVEGVLTHSRDAVMQSRHGVNDITESVSEQKVASTEIAQSMERIANMVEETNAAARSVSTSTGDLRTLSQNLAQAVSGFRVAQTDGSRPAAAGTTTQTPASRGRRFYDRQGWALTP